MSLPTLEEVPRRVSRLSIVAVARIRCSSFISFLARKKKLIKQSPHFYQLSAFRQHNRKMSWFEIIATATLKKRKTGLGTSPRVVRLIPRRPGSISSLYGANTDLKAKRNSVLNLEKKSRIQNGLIRPGIRTYFWLELWRSAIVCHFQACGHRSSRFAAPPDAPVWYRMTDLQLNFWVGRLYANTSKHVLEGSSRFAGSLRFLGWGNNYIYIYIHVAPTLYSLDVFLCHVYPASSRRSFWLSFV